MLTEQLPWQLTLSLPFSSPRIFLVLLLFHVSKFVVQIYALGKHDNTPVYMC